MRRSGERLFVWDWERSSRPLPVGFDVLHYWFESAFHREGLGVADASREASGKASPIDVRDALGIPDSESHALIQSLFLLERSVRLEEGRAAGMPVDERLLGGLVDLLQPGGDRMTASRARVATRRLAKTASRLYTVPTTGMRCLRNFLVIGTQRGGTTSLYRYLQQHPCVAPAVLNKGIHYFDTNFDRGPSWYRSHFQTTGSMTLRRRSAHGTERAITGEGSPYYIFHPLAAQRIADLLPHCLFHLDASRSHRARSLALPARGGARLRRPLVRGGPGAGGCSVGGGGSAGGGGAHVLQLRTPTPFVHRARDVSAGRSSVGGRRSPADQLLIIDSFELLLGPRRRVSKRASLPRVA